MIRRLLLLFLLLCSLQTLRATHIVGGEVTYRCLGNNEYEVTLQVFRDCYTGVPWFDTAFAWVALYDANWKIADTLLMPYTGVVDTLPIQLADPCFVLPPNVCVNTTTYRDTLTIPFKPGGYTLVYQICCRNNLIKNIYDPTETGTSFTARITEQALLECNSGAVFRQWPPVAICVNQPIDFDHGATDPDGDSLVYQLCTPYVGASLQNFQPKPPGPGPYEEVQWIDPPYNLLNVLGGDPLKIDSKTGFLTGVPDKIGNFVVGVCVEEYRAGTLIATTRRDFQYNVADCGKPTSAFFAPEVLCDTRTVKFENKSTDALFFRWYFQHGKNPAATSISFSPLYTYPDTGEYVVALISFGNNSSTCQDTFFHTIHITERYLDADFSVSYPDCAGGLTVQVTDLSTDTVVGVDSWRWTMNGPNTNLTSTEQQPSFTVTDPGSYQLQLIATAANGCSDTLLRTFEAPFPDLQNIESQLEICPGDSIHLNPDADLSLTYLWSPGETLDDAAAPNPLSKPTESTQYSLLATSVVSGCTSEKSVQVNVLNPGGAAATATPPKIFVGESTQLEAVIPGATTVVWSPGATLSDSTIFNPTATPTDTTLYTARTVLASGCAIEVSVLVVVIFPDCAEPYVFFPNAFSPNGDGENDALKLEGSFIESVNWVIYNRWGERVFEADSLDDAWDGTFKGKPLPAETYGYHLRVVCPNGEELKQKGNITLIR